MRLNKKKLLGVFEIFLGIFNYFFYLNVAEFENTTSYVGEIIMESGSSLYSMFFSWQSMTSLFISIVFILQGIINLKKKK
jgi:hypothetical protein